MRSSLGPADPESTCHGTPAPSPSLVAPPLHHHHRSLLHFVTPSPSPPTGDRIRCPLPADPGGPHRGARHRGVVQGQLPAVRCAVLRLPHLQYLHRCGTPLCDFPTLTHFRLGVERWPELCALHVPLHACSLLMPGQCYSSQSQLVWNSSTLPPDTH
jgi:hypothetical protein